MKRIAYLLTGTLLLVGLGSKEATAKSKVSGYLYQSTSQNISTAPVFYVGDLDRFSVEVVASSSTNLAVPFTSGTKSTATITVSSYTMLSSAVATSSITVVSTTGVSGCVVSLHGSQFIEGRDFFNGKTSSNTALSLQTFIDSYPGFDAGLPANTSVIFASASVAGANGNSWESTTTCPTAIYIVNAYMSGGRDNAYVGINGTYLTAGTDFAVGASSQATATNIAAAINANTTLADIIVSTSPGPGSVSVGVVYATSTAPGINGYTLTTSSYGFLTPSGFRFLGGTANAIDSANDIITATNTFTKAMTVWLSSTTNVAMPGLTWGTTYFAIPVVLGQSFKLSLTSTGSAVGLAIDISTSTTGGGSWTLNPSTFTAGASYQWKMSNDGINYSAYDTSYSLAASTVAVKDMGLFNYKFLMFNYTAPTRGGNVLDISIQGKKDD
jgi:hypothetical protein